MIDYSLTDIKDQVNVENVIGKKVKPVADGASFKNPYLNMG